MNHIYRCTWSRNVFACSSKRSTIFIDVLGHVTSSHVAESNQPYSGIILLQCLPPLIISLTGCDNPPEKKEICEFSELVKQTRICITWQWISKVLWWNTVGTAWWSKWKRSDGWTDLSQQHTHGSKVRGGWRIAWWSAVGRWLWLFFLFRAPLEVWCRNVFGTDYSDHSLQIAFFNLAC